MNTIPKLNERYTLNGQTFCIRGVDENKDILWVEQFPLRAIWPTSLAKWLESGAILKVESNP